MITSSLPKELAAHVSTAEAAKTLGRTRRLIQALCSRGAFPGSVRIGRDWFIPRSAVNARKKLQNGRLPKGGRGIKAYAV